MNNPMPEIKAGYLLKVSHTWKTDSWFMTVLPGRGFEAPSGHRLVGAQDGDLYACGNGWYWPLSQFKADPLKLVSIDAVYGYAPGSRLLDNSPIHRKLLWERNNENDLNN